MRSIRYSIQYNPEDAVQQYAVIDSIYEKSWLLLREINSRSIIMNKYDEFVQKELAAKLTPGEALK